MSRSEQSGVDPSDNGTAAALAAGNRAYEEKFGRVFLIRAAGLTAPEILAALHTRLSNPPAEEDAIVARQLREIALLRLEGVISE
jgi:2-oxo-4-hydroxy-4-carboxy-5-ureidoimidazoline decarboxylase